MRKPNNTPAIDWWAVAFIAMFCGPAPLFKMADVAWANWLRSGRLVR